MRVVPKRPSIEDVGLEKYLNDSKALHNGLGYAEFVQRVELQEPKTVIAKAFNVEKQTIYRWIEIFGKKS